MRLFDLDSNHKVVIHPEALLIQSFKVLWDKDKSKEKIQAMKELAYVYFMTDFKSPYDKYDAKEKSFQVSNDVMGNSEYKPTELVLNAIANYKNLQQTFSMKFLESAKTAARELMRFFDTVDLSERTDKGSPIYKPADITNALSQSVKVIEALDRWTEKVQKEQELTDTKITGGGTAGYFED
jgi:hypothetical protein